MVGLISLGCVKNLVDSERMLAQIGESGAIIADESAADTVVVNTCGFLGSARQEALEVIGELAERKRQGRLRRIVVAGCLVQRDGCKLREAIPEIDALVGVHNRSDVARAVWEGATNLYLGDYRPQAWSDQGRLRLTPRHYAYVRISEGCDQQCTFCTIPAIRGPMRSKPPETIVAECRELIADGARELILIGQDTTSYGKDLGYQEGLAGLLRRLDAACEGARWLRLMYAYPSGFSDAMIDAMAECDRVVKYLDIPLQHISDRILRAMGRRVRRDQIETLLRKLRERIPGLSIRTTLMVGFPGESKAEFEELLTFVREFGFDALGAFRYSLEPETPAGRMGEQLDEQTKQERYSRLMLAQQEVAMAAARRRVGQSFEVVVDGRSRRGWLARHAGQAPEVDSVCILEPEQPRRASGVGQRPGTSMLAGRWLTVYCTGSEGYDLVVRPQRGEPPAV